MVTDFVYQCAVINPVRFHPNSTDVDNFLDQMEYFCRNGGNANGVQRDVDEILPQIEELLKELKEAIKVERLNKGIKDGGVDKPESKD